MSSKAGLKESYLKEFPLFYRGKVRDLYDLGDKLLMVSTDRISAFDFILPTLIPDKGKILNQISAFWYRKLCDIVPNHMISIDWKDFPPELKSHRNKLEGRSMLIKKLKRIDVECVVRGYLAGSGWREYQSKQSIVGIKLPAGLLEAEKLPEPIFTPATKESAGAHDVNISFDELAAKVGEKKALFLKGKSLDLYKMAVSYAKERGVIIADTKFEFGLDEKNGETMLIDEAITPDSSRFWDKKKYKKGRTQESFDKQFVRNYLEKVKWKKTPPPPELPSEIVKKTQEKYKEAFSRLTTKREGA